jgi:hypothetical protein
METNVLEENFDLGKRGITVEMDRPRELVYNLGAFRAMEDLAHRWAKKNQIPIRDIVGPEIIPAGLLGNPRPIMNPAVIGSHIIFNNLGDDSFLSMALWGALRYENPKISVEEADAIYEAFIEKTGDRQDLVDILLEAYARAKNPRKYLEAKRKELKEIQEEATKLATDGSSPGEKSSGEVM